MKTGAKTSEEPPSPSDLEGWRGAVASGRLRRLRSEDIVAARLDYSRLDRPQSPVRIRLNATAVRVRHIGDPAAAAEVEIAYARNGALQAVRARACVLACYNMMIPYLVPELPAVQQQALHSLVKAPLVYTSVALRNWRAFHDHRRHAEFLRPDDERGIVNFYPITGDLARH